MYCIAFIVLLAGFGYCAGSSAKCDARVAAGVSFEKKIRAFEGPFLCALSGLFEQDK